VSRAFRISQRVEVLRPERCLARFGVDGCGEIQRGAMSARSQPTQITEVRECGAKCLLVREVEFISRRRWSS